MIINPAANLSPLSDQELDRLAELLQSHGPDAMSLPEVDGLLVALSCSPRLLLPSEYCRSFWETTVPSMTSSRRRSSTA